ncbi:MAG: LamG domain-containing protein, partial [Planctomycetota bacterium]|nr:LamG domain-containing protein [Planctomycetota bacterium]
MTRSLTALTLLALCGTLTAQAGSISFSNSDPNGGGVEVPHAAQLVPQSGITIEAWVTYDETTLGTSTTNRWPTIMRTGFQSQPNAFNLRVDAGRNADRILKWTVNADSRVQVRWNFQPGQLLTWTHVAATYDGSAARLFVNGQEVGSAKTTGPL